MWKNFERERGSIHDLAPTVLLSSTLHAGLWELKNEYHASDPLHACVYILCLHSVVCHVSVVFSWISLQSLRIKVPQNFNRNNHLLRIKEQTELFCKVIHNKHETVIRK